MKKLSLKPDADMTWIYENNHPDYNSARARYLREARSSAISSAPQWMIEEARSNDLLDDIKCPKLHNAAFETQSEVSARKAPCSNAAPFNMAASQDKQRDSADEGLEHHGPADAPPLNPLD